MPILLKLSLPDGKNEKNKFNDDSSVYDLIDFVKTNTSEKRPPSFYLGYPPVRLEWSSNAALLTSIGVTSGQLITVKFGEMPFPLRRVINADNSCLFNALSYACHHCRDLFSPSEWRQVAADAVVDNPDKYPPSFLGKSADDYATWIKQDSTWGGEIECNVHVYIVSSIY
jgi:hypothetical protein